MSERSFILAFLAILVVVTLGAGLDVMEVDAAQYAGMSRDMLLRGDPLHLFFRDADYLDKPPFLFWVTALSFKLFGVSDWSYRLPSFLFAALGLFSTYRFAALYHSTVVARTAALVLGCSAAFFLMTNDIRCDTVLTGVVITAIWLGCAWLESGRLLSLLGCAVAIAVGMLVKGPIGAVAPVIAIGAQGLMTDKVRRLFDPRIILAVGIVSLLLLPMCIGLYQQHGSHGLRFYFWEQSFGRITGENRWSDDSTVFFFTHEIIWQLLPWTLFVLLALWKDLKTIMLRKAMPEYASALGALILFVALSLSQFKLPHYLYVTLPLFAVLGARGLNEFADRPIRITQLVLLLLLWLVAMFLAVVTFPDGRWPFVLMLAIWLLLAILMVRKWSLERAIFPCSFILMIMIGVLLNGHLYPKLLSYQANAQAGQWAAMNGLDRDRFFGMQVSGSALDYYAGYPVKWLSNAEEASGVIAPGVVIYTDPERRDELLAAGLRPKRETVLVDHPVQLLSLPFLFPSSRAGLLRTRFLLEY